MARTERQRLRRQNPRAFKPNAEEQAQIDARQEAHIRKALNHELDRKPPHQRPGFNLPPVSCPTKTFSVAMYKYMGFDANVADMLFFGWARSVRKRSDLSLAEALRTFADRATVTWEMKKRFDDAVAARSEDSLLDELINISLSEEE